MEKKPNRRRQQDAKGRRKKPMKVTGVGLRRIPGIWRERADAQKKKFS